MALDQALMECHRQSSDSHSATLRFYQWSRPTVSLGYFQSTRDIPDRFHQVSKVRRSTGGGAIVHDHELTYSLTIDAKLDGKSTRQLLYRSVHQAVVNTLAEWGINAKAHRLDQRIVGNEAAFLCFQRRTDEDLIVNGYKVLGSAQRTTRDAVLQHGSLLLKSSRFAPELPGIEDLTSVRIEARQIAGRLAASVGQLLGIDFLASQPDSSELRKAENIRQDRYASQSWWSKR